MVKDRNIYKRNCNIHTKMGPYKNGEDREEEQEEGEELATMAIHEPSIFPNVEDFT